MINFSEILHVIFWRINLIESFQTLRRCFARTRTHSWESATWRWFVPWRPDPAPRPCAGSRTPPVNHSTCCPPPHSVLPTKWVNYVWLFQSNSLPFITDHVLRTIEGNVFTAICDSVQGRGRIHSVLVLLGDGGILLPDDPTPCPWLGLVWEEREGIGYPDQVNLSLPFPCPHLACLVRHGKDGGLLSFRSVTF